ncbi:hypothetical protein M011DRAFT_128583 [Sporormia fimetaria CBS 119925]|uniref:Uncharacterized protein n=1 Tax=Sporormia fimetaria CBS 119925 TaxID=1340428 RepID=A0A6A6V8G4_9PLEO|nr:hypothetical protein M011DRAFT_128583 [Sporormia fimetaria CBS 119925]
MNSRLRVPTSDKPPKVPPPSARAISAVITNNCPFNIYLNTASCLTNYASPSSLLRPSTSTTGWTNMTYALNDNCGHTIKLSRTLDFEGEIYQIEYSVDKGIVWYNLSAIDGDPFWEVQRALEVQGSQCERLVCEAGENEVGCAWPLMADCRARMGNDVRFVLC